jgi:tyrosinase
MHHCQIDRWFAVWQAAHDGRPDNWFTQDKTLPEEPLLPFIRSKVTDPARPYCWTSNASKSTRTFGYTYPEIGGIETGNVVEVQKRWKNKYDWARRLSPLDGITTSNGPPPTFEPLDLSKSQFFNGPQGVIPGFKPLSPKQSINTVEPPRLLSRIVATTLQLADKATPHVEASTNPAAPAASSSHTFVANTPQAIIDSAKKLNSSPKFSTNPLAKIPEETVSREWYIDNIVKK